MSGVSNLIPEIFTKIRTVLKEILVPLEKLLETDEKNISVKIQNVIFSSDAFLEKILLVILLYYFDCVFHVNDQEMYA